MASNRKNAQTTARFAQTATAAAAAVTSEDQVFEAPEGAAPESAPPASTPQVSSSAKDQLFGLFDQFLKEKGVNLAPAAAPAPEKRGPGRPKGSKNKPKAEPSAAADVVIPRQGGWELRVGKHEYQGRENIQVRAWGTNPDGVKFPSKGVTIQPSELASVIAALQALQ